MIKNSVLKEDIETFAIAPELADQLREATIVVTGATGLIGSMFVRCLANAHIGCRFILPVRNRERTRALFENEIDLVEIVEASDLARFFDAAEFRSDYIVHCASPTNGKEISSFPAETFLLPIESMRAILDYGRRQQIRGVVYLSSIEYYGELSGPDLIREDHQGFIARDSLRSAYPLGKQAAEYLSFCYAREYDSPVKCARLTQTFGAGIRPNDNRVFAQFARSVINGSDIILHTPGNSAKPYCYITDCISALLYILVKGLPGEAYNVASSATFVSIRQLAQIYSDISGCKSQVKLEIKDNAGYAPETSVNLSNDKLLALGWQSRYSLREMIERLISYLREEEMY